MADFSVTLSQPQAAGAKALAPVSEPGNALPAVLGSLVGIFAENQRQKNIEDKELRKQQIIGEYIREQTALSDAQQTGQLGSAEVGMRSRAISSKYAANYPNLLEDFSKARKNLSGITQLEVVESDEKVARDAYNSAVQKAVANGNVITPNTSQETITAMVTASQSKEAADVAFKRMAERASAARSASAEERAAVDWRNKNESIAVLSSLANTNLGAATSFVSDIMKRAKAGEDIETLKFEAQTQFASYEAGITAAGTFAPEVAGAWGKVFGTLKDIAMKATDPNAVAEDLEAQKKAIIARAQIMALTDNPSAQSVVAVSNLFGNQAISALRIDGAAVQVLTDLQKKLDVSLPVVGTSSEKAAFDFVTTSVKSSDWSTNSKTKDELTNVTNNILKDIGGQLGRDTNSVQLNQAAKFIASPEFAKLVREGVVDRGSMNGALDVMNLMYEKDIIRGVEAKLNEDYSVKISGTDTRTSKISDLIDVSFTGAGVNFSLKDIGYQTAFGKQNQRQFLSDMSSSQEVINRLIHVGAHLEGHVDYSKYWEENKHILMPSLFKEPAGASEKPQNAPTVIEVGGSTNIGGVTVKRVK